MALDEPKSSLTTSEIKTDLLTSTRENVAIFSTFIKPEAVPDP